MNIFGVVFLILAILRYYGLIEIHIAWIWVWLLVDVLFAIANAIGKSK